MRNLCTQRILWTAKCVLGILLLGYAGAALAAPESGEIKLAPNPAWCQRGYRCIQVGDYEKMTERVIVLRRDLALANPKSRHFGLGCAIGPGLVGVVESDFHTRLVPGALGLVCGGAVRF